MAQHCLSLALNKTDVTMLSKKRIPTISPVLISNIWVESKSAVKCLGVLIDSKKLFLEQIKREAEMAENSVLALSGLMKSIGGPQSSKICLLMAGTQSILLYGEEVWADWLRKKKYRKKSSKVQRQCALSISSAYRTLSKPNVFVIGGVVPIHLLVRLFVFCYTESYPYADATSGWKRSL